MAPLNTSAYIVISLAVNYLFLSDSGQGEHPTLEIEPFNAAMEQNDYEVRFSTSGLTDADFAD